jgi:hypothetical protein
MSHMSPRLYWIMAVTHLVLLVFFEVMHLWHARPR